MPRFRSLKTNFVAGELDDLLQGRSDIKHYFNGADYARNVIILPQGGARTRPGSRLVWTVPEVSAGVRSNVRLCSFQFSTEQTYLFVFHHLKVSIFREEALVAEVTTPWTSAQLIASLGPQSELLSAGISWTQSLDTLLVFHGDVQPREIQRTGSHTSWAISTIDFENMPLREFAGEVYVNGVDEVQDVDILIGGAAWQYTDGQTVKLVLEDEETETIEISSTTATMAARIQAALRELPNTTATGITCAYTGGTNYRVTFGGGDGKRPWGSMAFSNVSVQDRAPSIGISIQTRGELPGEDVWSDDKGWPRCGVFFQGRLWMAGSRSLPNSVWASRAGAPFDFNTRRLSDDYAIQVTTDTDDVPAFLAIYAGRHLQFFSTAGEFYVPSSEDEAVTPANMVLRRTTSRGVRPGCKPIEVDGATIFPQRGGKALREFIFADVEAAYQANNISLLASHLMRDPVGFTLRRSTNTEDADFIFMANTDGTMTVFCTLRTQEVNAFTLWNTAGSYIDCAGLLDDVYFATVREIDGEEVTFIEVMDDTISLDCAVVGEDAAGATAAHLPNTEVGINVDGFVQARLETDGSGDVTFERAAETSFAVGLPWPEVLPDLHPGLIWCLKTLPVEEQLPDGTMMGKKRRIVNLSLRLHETQGIVVNGNRLSFQNFGDVLLDQPPPEFTGVKNIRGLLGWDYDGAVVMGDTTETKATVLGLAWAVSV
jgi:hypothetical protein